MMARLPPPVNPRRAGTVPARNREVHRARRLVETTDGLSARAALHVAVMRRRDGTAILTFDPGPDGMPGIERVREQPLDGSRPQRTSAGSGASPAEIRATTAWVSPHARNGSRGSR